MVCGNLMESNRDIVCCAPLKLWTGSGLSFLQKCQAQQPRPEHLSGSRETKEESRIIPKRIQIQRSLSPPVCGLGIDRFRLNGR
jgi:hypothetical protein